jgi:simple sugar transport system substrate-binding protein
MHSIARLVPIAVFGALAMVLSCAESPDDPNDSQDSTVVSEASSPPDTPRSKPEPEAVPADEEIRIVFVTHGQSSDPFWSVVINGAGDAAADLGVAVEYHAPLRFDMVEMSDRIAATVASRPDGLVVSIPDAAALNAAIRDAIDTGIPVVSINSGGDVYRDLGVLAHIGQTEYEAGYESGVRLARAGVRQALCVNHEVGNTALDERCKGFRDALEERRAVAYALVVNLADPDDTQQRIAGAITTGPAIDGILTLGPNGAAPALAALRQTGKIREVALATFDLSPEVLEAIRDGEMNFAVDQQQYLQGYLPVVFLVKYLETGTIPGGGDVIRTGPSFVTQDTAADVIDLSARGIR